MCLCDFLSASWILVIKWYFWGKYSASWVRWDLFHSVTTPPSTLVERRFLSNFDSLNGIQGDWHTLYQHQHCHLLVWCSLPNDKQMVRLVDNGDTEIKLSSHYNGNGMDEYFKSQPSHLTFESPNVGASIPNTAAWPVSSNEWISCRFTRNLARLLQCILSLGQEYFGESSFSSQTSHSNHR